MKKIKVLLVEPKEDPKVVDVSNTLEGMQGLVNGYIQAFYPYDYPVVVVCSERSRK